MNTIIEEYSFKIYKKDSKDKIRVLHVHTEGADLIQESGLIGGKLTVHKSTCVGKNIGRSNETTPEQQAQLEAISKIENKMSTGYFVTVEDARDNIVTLPMLAKDYKKEKDKVVFPCWVQPKLDGMRALGNGEKGIISRKGKAIYGLLNIQAILNDIGGDIILDGELYAHGLNFQENMRLIKKYREGESEKVKYHVYDIVSDKCFKERYAILSELVEGWGLEIVPTYECDDEVDLQDHHKQFLAQGYEGTMIRHSNAGYGVNKRDSQLLKYKDFLDEVYEVVDVVPSEKNPEQGVVHCKLADGRTFGCGMKFSHKEREEILVNKANYIGQKSETRFFEFSEDGIPRFPVCHGFRLDK